MADDFYDLCNVTPVDDAGGLSIVRAKALHDALATRRDFSVVRLLKSSGSALAMHEFVIVDVECDGVPTRNPHGIDYRERLALCIPENPNALVEVLALRKGFPVLIHQNNGLRDGPASLCLYFEPPPSVLRTWTPQKFLRRIKWWLQQSAKGELHPADQPVEHLFFASKYELVLPWNFNEMRKSTAHRLVIRPRLKRPDNGMTCVVEAIPASATPPGVTATHIELTLPAVVHGFVERDPATLGELSEILEARGVKLLPQLQEVLRQPVGAGGVPVTDHETFVILILHIPMRRDENTEPDQIAHRAFLMMTDAMKLGVATGTLMVHEKQYFVDASSALGAPPNQAWRQEPISPMDVSRQLDAAEPALDSAARSQVGVPCAHLHRAERRAGVLRS